MAGGTTVGLAAARARARAQQVATARTARQTVARATGLPAGGLPLGGLGGYTGARSDRRMMAEWPTPFGNADQVTNPDLPTLRARCQDLLRNTPLAVGAANTMVTSAIGTGLTVKPRIDRKLLGLSDADAEAWESHAERIWLAWATSSECDLAGRLDFFSLQAVVDHAEFADGDCFVLRRYKPRPNDLIALKLQLVEADRVSNPSLTIDTDRLSGGVEIDEDGRPVQYWMTDRNPYSWLGASQTWQAVPAFGAGTGDRLVLHQYRPKRIGQTRGVPELAPVVETLRGLGVYSDAELMAAVISSMFTVFVKTQGGQGLGLVDPNQPASVPANQYRLGNGAIVGLAAGEEIEIADPKRPNAGFDPFMLAHTKYIGAALELPFEVMVKHFSASYSASRAALLEAWRAILTRRARRIRHLCQPVYQWALSEAIARNLLQAPRFFDDPLVRRAYLGAEWTGPAMGQLNPKDEVDAARERIALGLSSRAQETAQITGGDWETTHVQLAREHRMRVEAGLEADTAPGEPIASRTGTGTEAPTPVPTNPDDLGPGEDPPVAGDGTDAGGEL